MPAAWNQHDERQFKAILSSCKTGRKRRSTKTCKRIAGATVNKRRRLEGRALNEVRLAASQLAACLLRNRKRCP